MNIYQTMKTSFSSLSTAAQRRENRLTPQQERGRLDRQKDFLEARTFDAEKKLAVLHADHWVGRTKWMALKMVVGFDFEWNNTDKVPDTWWCSGNTFLSHCWRAGSPQEQVLTGERLLPNHLQLVSWHSGYGLCLDIARAWCSGHVFLTCLQA